MTADDILGYLEKASYLTTFLPVLQGSKAINIQLAAMADLAVKGCQEYVKMLVAAQEIRKESRREETPDFLAAVSRVIDI